MTVTLPSPQSHALVAPKHHAAKSARRTRPGTHLEPESANPAQMQEAEDRLLAAAIEQFAQDGNALDQALEDMAILSAELHRSRRGPLLLRSTTNLNRVEDLLLEAVLRAHPNREGALDRLLDAVAPEEASAIETRRREEFDASVDNDFDGLA